MCVHHWHLDESDYGKCVVCGTGKDFRLGVDKALGAEHKTVRKDFHYNRDMVATGGFYLEGTINRSIRTTDHCFSVEWIE